MLSVIDGSKLIQNLSGGLAFECSDHVAQHDGGRVAQQEVDVVNVTVNFGDFAVGFGGRLLQDLAQKVSPLSGECRMAKFRTKDDVSRQVVDAVACNIEVEVPDTLLHGLGGFLVRDAEEINTVRFRLYPSRAQEQVLKRWIGAQRYNYNQKVEELDYQLWLKNNAKFSNRFQEPEEKFCPWDQTFSKYKQSAPWLEEIPSFIRRNGCSRFRAAMSQWGKGKGRPELKSRKSVQSVLLTSECFTLRTLEHDGSREDCLWIGTKSKNYRVLKWVSYCEYKEPRQISITHEPDGKWFVGFSFESGTIPPKCETPQAKEEVLAVDRGVVNPATDSTGRFYDFTRAEKVKLEKREKKRTQLQVRLARQKNGSKRRAKTKQAIAATHAKDKRSRLNAAHRIANHLVNQAIGTGYKTIGFEDLQLSKMTRRANAKQDIDGQYLPNGQAAKSGLNKSILGRGLGRLKTLVEYRCRRSGLTFVEVNPAYTSTECTECHNKDKRNRQSQSDFECVRCAHKEHADVIGAANVRDKAFKKITEISPGTSLKNARLLKARKGQPLKFV
jgi:putative transposase